MLHISKSQQIMATPYLQTANENADRNAMIVNKAGNRCGNPAMCPTGSIAIARKLPKENLYWKLHCKTTTKHEHLVGVL
jgi:hypothetical protein